MIIIEPRITKGEKEFLCFKTALELNKVVFKTKLII